MHVVHTDLACRNFLVFKLEQEPENTKVKITDFMNALCLPAKAKHMIKKIRQATRWCAPETIVSNKWSYKTDVWSLGAALWELFADGEAPWKCHGKRSDIANRLRELVFDPDASVPDLSDDFPAPASPLLSAAHEALLSCLHPHPSFRPSAKQMTATFEQILQDLSKELDLDQEHTTANFVDAFLPTQKYEQQVSRPTLIVPPRMCEQGVTVTTASSTRHSETESVPRPATPVSAWHIDISQGTVRQELLAKALESRHKTAQSGYVMTPPTRCPSTPVSRRSPDPSRRSPETRCISFGSESPDRVVCASKVPHEGPFPRLLSREVSETFANLQNLKTCLSSPGKSNASLGCLTDFLSSPEAVRGLDAENLISLRRRVAAAQITDSRYQSPVPMPRSAALVIQCQDSKRYSSQIRGLVHETIVPLKRIANSRYQSPVPMPRSGASVLR